MHEGLLYVVARSGLYFSILGVHVLRWRVNKSFTTLLLNNKLASISAQKISSLHLRRPWVNTIPDLPDFVLEHDGVRLVFDFINVSVALKLAMLYIPILELGLNIGPIPNPKKCPFFPIYQSKLNSQLYNPSNLGGKKTNEINQQNLNVSCLSFRRRNE
jgi:hypothetical protein